jgi:phosphate transport system permease protein
MEKQNMNQSAFSNNRKSGIIPRLSKLLHHGDRPWNVLLISVSLFVLFLIIVVAGLLWTQSEGTQKQFGIQFLLPTQAATWDPVNQKYNAWPFIYGTLITALIAVLLAVPTGVGIAIFLSELCPEWLRAPLGTLIELLAAIPSVVYGIWGLFVFLPAVVVPIGTFLQKVLGFLPLFSGPLSLSGSSRLAAGLILAIMIIPTISAISRDVLRAIPNSQREASLALGATKWEMISKVLLPYGLSGILGAVIIGLGRAIGETMAVTMVIGNSIDNSVSLLKPGYTMASVIANQFAETFDPTHTQALIEVGLILFFITLLLNVFARLLVWWVSRRNPQGERA